MVIIEHSELFDCWRLVRQDLVGRHQRISDHVDQVEYQPISSTLSFLIKGIMQTFSLYNENLTVTFYSTVVCKKLNHLLLYSVKTLIV